MVNGAAPLLELKGVKKYFPVTKGLVMMKTVGQVQAAGSANCARRTPVR